MCTQCYLEIKKLSKFLERIRQHKLGLDWQSKRDLQEVEDKVILKIKTLSCNNNSNKDMVK